MFCVSRCCRLGVHKKTSFQPKTRDALRQAVIDWANGKTKQHGPISGWDVTKVKDMSYLFSPYETPNGKSVYKNLTNFNDDISGWQVQGVTDMSYMFYYAETFNRSISSWQTGKVIDMSSMFAYASHFSQDLPLWDVSNVELMSYKNSYSGNKFWRLDFGV